MHTRDKPREAAPGVKLDPITIQLLWNRLVSVVDEASSGLIRTAYTSVAETAIVPAQDILNLGSEARMNRPGAEQDNWTWRLRPGALTSEHASKLRKLAEIAGRV